MSSVSVGFFWPPSSFGSGLSTFSQPDTVSPGAVSGVAVASPAEPVVVVAAGGEQQDAAEEQEHGGGEAAHRREDNGRP